MNGLSSKMFAPRNSNRHQSAINIKYISNVNLRRILGCRILDHVWDYSFSGDGNVVEPCISYLRRKADQGEPRLIHTIRGVGYMLRVPPP